MSVYVSLCLSPFHVIFFEAYFAPTSRSRMTNIFKDSESLGKSAGKKWSQNWTFLLGSGLKPPRKKKFFFWWLCGPVSVRRLYNDMRRLYWDMRRLYWYDAVILRLVLDDFSRLLILQNFIGPTIRIGREIRWLPYAGFFWPSSYGCLSENWNNLEIVKNLGCP